MRSSSKAGRPLVGTAGLCVALVLSGCGGAVLAPLSPSAAPDPYAAAERSAVAAARTVVDPVALAAGVSNVDFEVVPDEQSLEAAIGAPAGTDRDVAAVAAIAPGASVPKVFVDEDAMGELTSQGIEIVLTHEATHVLTGVVGNTSMPLWLVEGFADYVALRDVRKPLSVTAGRIAHEVGNDGVPSHLPLRPDFDAAQAVGGDTYTAEYEAAWLACRLLAQRGGEKRLVALYAEVRDGDSLEDALGSGFGLTVARLTHLWQAQLRALAFPLTSQ